MERMSAGTDMSAKNADTTLDNAAHGGCPATTCSAFIEVEYYVSPCGKFHGCSEDYTEEEWDEIVAGDNVIVPVGTTLESAIAQLADAGLCREEVEEMLGHSLPNRELCQPESVDNQ